MPSERMSPPAKLSTLSQTAMPSTSIRRCVNGSPAAPLGFSLHPSSASWLNAVEGFFAKLTTRRLRCGVFRSVVDFQEANRFIAETNTNPKPVAWTADPARVLAAITRGKQALESIH